MILEEVERVGIAGIDLEDLLRPGGRVVGPALLLLDLDDLSQARDPLLRRQAADGHRQRVHHVLLAPGVPVELHQPLGGLGVALLEQRLVADDGVLHLTGLEVGVSEASPHVVGVGRVRGHLQIGHPPDGQQVLAAHVGGELLEEIQGAVVIGCRVQGRLGIGQPVVGRHRLGHLVQQVRCTLAVGGGGLRLRLVLGPAQEQRRQVVLDCQVRRRLIERALERDDRPLEIAELLCAQVSQLAQQRHLALTVGLGVGLEIVERGRGLEVPGGAVDLACGVDGGDQRRVELEGLAVVMNGAVDTLELLLPDLADLLVHLRDVTGIGLRLAEGLRPLLEDVEHAALIAHLLEQLLQAHGRVHVEVASLESALVERDGAPTVRQVRAHHVAGLVEGLGGAGATGGARGPALEQVHQRRVVALTVIVGAQSAEGLRIVRVPTQSGDQILSSRIHSHTAARERRLSV